jgi:hypothetical protein
VDKPAFPQTRTLPDGSHEECEGLTMRDYFAAKVLQALITRESNMHPNPLMYAGAAYDIADAMLEARKQ